MDRTEPISIAALLVILLGLCIIFWKRLSIVLGLIVLIITLYILQIASSPYHHQIIGSVVFSDLAFAPSHIATPPFLITIFTSMFLHASLIHLLFNLFALYFIGTLLESRIGSVHFFIIYLIAGFIGGITWASIHWGEIVLAVGASGAIMGILGAFSRLYSRERLRIFLLFFPLPPMPAYAIFVILLAIDLAIALTGVGFIAAEAHLGGAIAGFVLAPFIVKLPTSFTRKREPIFVHLTSLEELATTAELRGILQNIEKETVPEVQEVWFRHFINKARCPICGGRLVVRKNMLLSDCGWRMKI